MSVIYDAWNFIIPFCSLPPFFSFPIYFCIQKFHFKSKKIKKKVYKYTNILIYIHPFITNELQITKTIFPSLSLYYYLKFHSFINYPYINNFSIFFFYLQKFIKFINYKNRKYLFVYFTPSIIF